MGSVSREVVSNCVSIRLSLRYGYTKDVRMLLASGADGNAGDAKVSFCVHGILSTVTLQMLIGVNCVC